MNSPGNESTQHDDEELIRWARRVLDLPREQGDRLRGLLLQQLADEEFVIADHVRSAILVLACHGPDRAAVSPPAEFYDDCEAPFTEEIDRFCAAFFSVPVQERKLRWEQLRSSKKLTPPQRLRLEALEPGLEVEFSPSTNGNGEVAELAEIIRELFVLAPPKRAEHWRIQRGRMQSDMAGWSDAAAELRKQQPEIAALLPEPVEELVQLHPQIQLQAQQREKRVQARRARAAYRESVYEPELDSTESGSSSLWIGIVVIAVVVVFRYLAYLEEATISTSLPTIPPAKWQPTEIPMDSNRFPIAPMSGMSESDRQQRRNSVLKAILRKNTRKRIGESSDGSPILKIDPQQASRIDEILRRYLNGRKLPEKERQELLRELLSPDTARNTVPRGVITPAKVIPARAESGNARQKRIKLKAKKTSSNKSSPPPASERESPR